MKNDKTKKIILDIAYPALVTVATLLLWYVAALIIDVKLILPTPIDAFRQFFAYFAQTEFWAALGNTFLRAVYSFAIGFAVAIILASLSATFSVARKIINPFVAIIRSVPTMSVILLLTIWLSAALTPTAVAMIVIFPTLYTAFLAAIDSVDKNLLQMSKVYGVSKKDIVFKLYIPNMLPQMFENVAAGFSLNLKLVIAAEALALSRNSIGKMMQYAKVAIEPAQLFALTIAAVILGVICETVIRFVGKKAIRWQK